MLCDLKMIKKAKSKKSTSADPSRRRKDVKEEVKKSQEEENSTDFGGIPNRDLKKNLGCG